jgi:hypothetical protein
MKTREPVILGALLVAAILSTSSATEPVQFGRDVLPILSAACFSCHGPDEHDRKGDLRLDKEADAKKEHEDGVPVFPGHPEKSSILVRLLSKDADEVMPPPKSHKHLKAEQVETLRRWIVEGAIWGRHWSFEPIRPLSGTIDSLVKGALEKKGLQLRPAAAPHVLVRRLGLDIVGIPPTPEQADEFARDPSSAAYERLVDELLANSQFGEHWARMWLDLARYADTKGYEKDLERSIWPWRDWVVDALNADMPLDRFTEEQLAGDLLPNPSESQLIATAFHRNTMTNEEAGTDREEFRQLAVKDRVDTTVQVWMGLTMGCAKCHTHKYDPISQEEYYSFYALFNQTEDSNLGSDEPLLFKPTPGQQRDLDRQKAELDEILKLLDEARKNDPSAVLGNNLDPADSPDISALKRRLSHKRDEQKLLRGIVFSVPVLRELPEAKKRVTKLHRRGNFLDLGAPVTPGVPAAFHPLPPGATPNRVGVAKWLMSAENPLTARVWVNRIWARLFGTGIVETEEDFGTLGSAPSNPELLDWLAARYRDDQWSLKRLIRTIVLSDAYRQESSITAALLNADPKNAFSSRGARFRLSAEVIRDQALSVSGLLSSKKGGPSVMPPQPGGLWRSAYSARTWTDAEGEDRYRRGLYTYLKRTTPYPSFTTFDAGSGEVCQIRRIRTNTPLQALITLNDPVFMEAAAALAKRMVTEAESQEARVARGLRLALLRPLTSGECAALMRLQGELHSVFEGRSEGVDRLLKGTRAKVPEGISKAEFAAWISTANAILNLDEFLTRN